MNLEAQPDISTQSGTTNTAGPEEPRQKTTAPAKTGPKRALWTLVLLLLCGTLVYHPALRTPLLLDDYLHVAMVDGRFPAKRSPFSLYDFINDQDRAALTERGLLPWWSHPKLKVRFFRPLSSAVRWADHKAFGDKPLLLHLHSFVWWALAVLAARSLFARLLSKRASLFATFAFALAPCHTLPLAWIANREALLSLVFGTTALGFYVRFREQEKLGWASLSAFCFSLAVLSGEYAVSFGGYVLAYEIVFRKGSWLRSALATWPFVVPAAVYLGVRRVLDYGTFASGFYTDPFREPWSFLRTAPRRIVTLLLDGWFSLDEETLTPDTPFWLLLLLLLVSAPLLFVPLRDAFRALDQAKRQRLSFLMLGSAFAIFPVLAVVPSARVLGACLLGITASVGVLLEHVWFASDAVDARQAGHAKAQLSGFVALLMGFFHFVHGPVTAMLVGRRFYRSATDFVTHTLPMKEKLPSMKDVDLVVIRTAASAFFLPFALDLSDKPNPRWRILAQTGHVLFLRRGPRTFDLVVPPERSLFPITQGQLFRSVDAKLVVGDVIRLPRFSVTILEVGSQGPRSARFELDTDLEAEALTWINESHVGFEPTTLPRIGFGKPFDP